MSEHAWAAENLSDYVAGMMDAVESQRLSRHLAECAECTAALGQWQRLDESIAQLFADARPAPGTPDRVIQGLRTARRPSPWVSIAAGLAAAVLIGALGAGMHFLSAADLPLPGNGLFDKLFSSKNSTVAQAGRNDQPGTPSAGNMNPGQRNDGETKTREGRPEEQRPPTIGMGTGTMASYANTSNNPTRNFFNDFNQPPGNTTAQGNTLSVLNIAPANPADPFNPFYINPHSAGLVANVSNRSWNIADGSVNTVQVQGQGQGDNWGQNSRLNFNNFTSANNFGNSVNLGVGNTAVQLNDQSNSMLWNDTTLSAGDYIAYLQGGKYGQPQPQPRQGAPSQPTLDQSKRIMKTVYKDVAQNDPNDVLKQLADLAPSRPGAGASSQSSSSQGPSASLAGGGSIMQDPPAGTPAGEGPRGGDERAPGSSVASLQPEKGRPLTGSPHMPAALAPPPASRDTTLQPAGPDDDARKIIRTGEVEFDVTSFDAANKEIDRLLEPMRKRGGNRSTSRVDRLANGKMRGSVVVRVPPEFFDKFVLDLQKIGDLKSQRISSAEVTKQYTDNESKLRALRITEKQCEEILRTGKGDTKDLIASTILLGTVRADIEKIEGENRYFRDQVGLCTLTISLTEKEIQNAAVLVLYEKATLTVAVEDVKKAQEAVWAATAEPELKARVLKSESKEQDGFFVVVFELEAAHDAAGKLRSRLDALGAITAQNVQSSQQTEGGSVLGPERKTRKNDVHITLTLVDLASIKRVFKEKVTLNLAVDDVDKAKDKARLDAVELKARLAVKSETRQQTDGDAMIQLEVDVPQEHAAEMRKRLDALGEVLKQAVEPGDAANQAKIPKARSNDVRFIVELRAVAGIKPRETFHREIACRDVNASLGRLQEEVGKRRGQAGVPLINGSDQAQSKFATITATFEFSVSNQFQKEVEKLLEEMGDRVKYSTTAAPQAESTIKKVGYKIVLVNLASQPPREAAVLTVEVKDVKTSLALVRSMFKEAKGSTITFDQGPFTFDDKGELKGLITCVIPLTAKSDLVQRITEMGSVKKQNFISNPQAPESSQPLAVLAIELTGTPGIVPNDEGLWPQIRTSLYYAFKLLALSLMFIVIGVCVILPWAIVIIVAVKLVRRLRGTSAAS